VFGHQRMVAAERLGLIGAEVDVLALDLDVPAVLLRTVERLRKMRYGCEPLGNSRAGRSAYPFGRLPPAGGISRDVVMGLGAGATKLLPVYPQISPILPQSLALLPILWHLRHIDSP